MAEIDFGNNIIVDVDDPTPEKAEEIKQKLIADGLLPSGDVKPKQPFLNATRLLGSDPSSPDFKPAIPIPIQELPELAGTMISANPVLSALGATGGEAWKQVAQRFGILEGQPPETSLEAAQEIGKAGLRGLGAGVVGKGFGAAASKLGKTFAKGVTPAIKEQIASAEKLGITAPLRTMTENPRVQATERMAEFAPFGIGAEITKIKNAAFNKLY